MGKRGKKPALQRAYIGTRERLIELKPAEPSGVPTDAGGPWAGQSTEVSYSRGDEVKVRTQEPWQMPGPEPTPMPLEWWEEQVRERLAAAMQVLKMLPIGATDRPSTKCAAMLPIVRSWRDYGHWELEVREQPTAEQISAMEEVLTWVFLVPDAWRRALMGVAIGIPLRRIARRMGCSHELVRILERKAVERIARRIGQKKI